MEIKSCYTDLKVTASGKKLDELLETAAKLGYRRVALDTEMGLTSRKTQPPLAKVLADMIEQANVPNGLEVLKRITISVNEMNLLQSVQGSPVLQDYDLIAIKTRDEKVFQACCSSITTDIVSLELGERLDFNFRRSQVTQIISRGTMFEICYTPAIRDQTARRHTIANAIHLVTFSKGKGIIVSSGAEKSIDLRGPLDIINLCHLFGLKTEQCKTCITSNCRQVLVHSKWRKEVVKGVISCEAISKDTTEKPEIIKRKRNREEEEMDTKRKTVDIKRKKAIEQEEEEEEEEQEEETR